MGGHSSGRNAGMIRQAVSDPVLAELTREGRESLRAADKAWKFNFNSTGSLLLAKGGGLEELRRIQKTLADKKLKAEWWTPAQAARRVSLLKGGDFEEALFCPTDALVDIHALLEGFLKQLKRYNVSVRLGLPLRRIRREGGGFLVEAGWEVFHADKIVNAAGAWAASVGEKAGAFKIPFSAYRRHLYFTRSCPGMKKNWPFVWDLSYQFYFRPFGKGLMLSPCDKELMTMQWVKRAEKAEKTDARIEKTLRKKLELFSKNFTPLEIARAQAGLRTMTPDGRFVIGEDPRVKKFYWVAGLGGHGLTTSFSVGRLAADLIDGRETDLKVTAGVSPSRFGDGDHASKS